MTNYNVGPIELDLKSSCWLAGIFAGAVLGACLVLAYVPLDYRIKLPLAAAVIIAGIYHTLRDALLVMPKSIVRLTLSSKGKFHMVSRNGVETAVSILPSSFVMPYLTVLNFKTGKRFTGRSIVITPDRVDEEAFRRLRVWLRWSPQAVSDDVAEEV